MLMLFFDSGRNRFAVSCVYVQEVVPQVELAPLHRVPSYVVGELNLRGIPVPVVSLGLLIGSESESDRLHTRLIVLRIEKEGEDRLLAIRAERVIQSDQVEEGEFVDTGIRTEGLPFLTGILTVPSGQIQELDVERLDQFLEPYLYVEQSDG